MMRTGKIRRRSFRHDHRDIEPDRRPDREQRRGGQQHAEDVERVAVLDLNLRGGEVAAKLEQAGTRITDALISRSSKMTESVRESAEQLVSVIVSAATR